MYENWKDHHMPRNQREAGIDHLAWDRTPRLRSIGEDLLVLFFLSVFATLGLALGMYLGGH